MSDVAEELDQDKPDALVSDEENTEENMENGDEEEEEEEQPLHLRTRMIPAIVMLFGGSGAAIFTFIRHDSLLTSLEIIFVSLCIFLVMGDIIKLLLDSIEIEVPDKTGDNKDKVIEKESPESAEDGAQQTGETEG